MNKKLDFFNEFLVVGVLFIIRVIMYLIGKKQRERDCRYLFGYYYFYKFFVVDLIIFIDVSFVDYFIYFVVSEFFIKVGYDVFQFGSRNEFILVFVKYLESFFQFFFRISIFYFFCYQVQKFSKINGFVFISVNFINYVLKFSFSWILFERFYYCFEFFGGDGI